MTERVYFSGRTLEQAVLAAARHHGIDPSSLAYEPIEKRHGFVKQPRGVVIRVDPSRPQLGSEAGLAAPTPPAEASATGEEPAAEVAVESVTAAESVEVVEVDEDSGDDSDENESAADSEDDESIVEPVLEPVVAVAAASEEAAETPPEVKNAVATDDDDREPRSDRSRSTPAQGASEEAIEDAAARWLDSLLDLGALDLDFEVQFGEEGLEIVLEGPDEEVVLDEEGELLRAFQHLLPRLIQSDVGQLVHCRVDCDGFQAKREKRLRDLARRVADEVADRGRPKTLRPMHPADRRIVHLELADDPDVYTESVGTGYFKRVMVRSE